MPEALLPGGACRDAGAHRDDGGLKFTSTRGEAWELTNPYLPADPAIDRSRPRIHQPCLAAVGPSPAVGRSRTSATGTSLISVSTDIEYCLRCLRISRGHVFPYV